MKRRPCLSAIALFAALMLLIAGCTGTPTPSGGSASAPQSSEAAPAQNIASTDSDAAVNAGEAYKAAVTPASIRSAMTIIAITPILFTYPFLQKYFVKGLTLGGVKG